MAAHDQREQLLKDFYYGTVPNDGSLRGPAALHQALKEAGHTEISLKDCKKFLSGQDTYTLYRNARKNFERNKIHVEEVGELMQYDIMEIPDYASENKGYRYVLICQDTWSRFTYAIPMRTKSANEVVLALKKVFETGYIPQSAYSDKDKAFLSTKVKALMAKHGINTYTTTSKVKAPHVERWIRSARTAIQRHFYANNTHNWLEALTNFVHQYNRRKHSTHKQKPIDVKNDSQSDWAAWYTVYGKKEVNKNKKADRKPQNNKEKRKRWKKSTRLEPKVGDYVRLSRIRGIFEKESNEQGAWTEEVFKIVQIKTHDNQTMYQLVDTKNNKLDGLAYRDEIQVIDYNPGGLFVVENVLRKRRIGGKLQYLVKWRGYPHQFNSYVDSQDIRHLQQNL